MSLSLINGGLMGGWAARMQHFRRLPETDTIVTLQRV
jgi:hypothetical protein